MLCRVSMCIQPYIIIRNVFSTIYTALIFALNALLSSVTRLIYAAKRALTPNIPQSSPARIPTIHIRIFDALRPFLLYSRANISIPKKTTTIPNITLITWVSTFFKINAPGILPAITNTERITHTPASSFFRFFHVRIKLAGYPSNRATAEIFTFTVPKLKKEVNTRVLAKPHSPFTKYAIIAAKNHKYILTKPNFLISQNHKKYHLNHHMILHMILRMGLHMNRHFPALFQTVHILSVQFPDINLFFSCIQLHL